MPLVGTVIPLPTLLLIQQCTPPLVPLAEIVMLLPVFLLNALNPRSDSPQTLTKNGWRRTLLLARDVPLLLPKNPLLDEFPVLIEPSHPRARLRHPSRRLNRPSSPHSALNNLLSALLLLHPIVTQDAIASLPYPRRIHSGVY